MSLRLAFAGTPDFAAQHLSTLLESNHHIVGVYTQPDRPAGRGKQDRPSAVKTLALDHNLPVYQPASFRDAESLQQLSALKLDALVVVAYGLLLPQSVLDIPTFGCLNVHGSLLPRWRGAAPIQRAIEAGDADSGVTIMSMDAGLDTGPMLLQARCAISPLATSGDLYRQLAELGPAALLEVLNDLPEQLASAQAQDNDLATKAAKISKAEALINWQEPAAVLARRIRAFNPAPGCYSFIDGQRIKVWHALPAPGTSAGPAGSIVSAGADALRVRCSEGELHIQTLQVPGAKAMSVADVLRGRSDLFAPGKQFSNASTQ